MPRCSFCKNDIEEGTGKLLVTKVGKPLFFCSHKCEKFSVRGTDSKKLKWAKGE